MALKNLVAQKAQLTEEAIEDLVSDYARYDIDERVLLFTPEAVQLSNKDKILIFLVAQQGWQFVLEDSIDVEVTPSEMEESLGIAGGTLRPLLMELRKRKLVVSRSGKYSVRSLSLDAIKTELEGRTSSLPRSNKHSNASSGGRPNKRNNSDASSVSSPEIDSHKASRRTKPSGPRPGKAFNELIDEGFFDTGKTLAEVQARFHERAIIINQTSLPKYLLKATRDERLVRKKKVVGKKRVWVYTTRNDRVQVSDIQEPPQDVAS